MAQPITDELKKEKARIASLVQDILVEKLKKHEIEVDRAKSIARAVVDALNNCANPALIEEVLPQLSKEFIELQTILERQEDLCRQDVEQTVTAFVRKLIGEGKFAEAHTFAEAALKKLAERGRSCRSVRTDIEETFDVTLYPKHAKVVPPDQLLVPIPQPELSLKTHHLSTEQSDSPTNQAMPERARPSRNAFVLKNEITEAAEGSDSDLVPVPPPHIPKHARPPEPPPTTKDFSERTVSDEQENGVGRQDQLLPGRIATEPSQVSQAAKKVGRVIAHGGREILDKTEGVLHRHFEKRREKKEHDELSDDELIDRRKPDEGPKYE